MTTDEHVLVVDQDQRFAVDLVTILHSLGFGAAAARSAQDAIESAERCRPTLLLAHVDFEGELLGVRLANTIRTRFDSSVILMSSRTNGEVAAAMVAADPAGVLCKPFHCGQLKITLRLALGRRAAGRLAADAFDSRHAGAGRPELEAALRRIATEISRVGLSADFS